MNLRAWIWYLLSVDMSFEASLKAFNINHTQWEQAAMERSQWRSAVYNGAKKQEAYRIATAEQRRKDRKDGISKCPKAATIRCPYCSKNFQARIGLTSHLRTRRTRIPQT